jgi:hypothetical protein
MIKRTLFDSEQDMFRDSFRKFLLEEAFPIMSSGKKTDRSLVSSGKKPGKWVI